MIANPCQGFTYCIVVRFLNSLGKRILSPSWEAPRRWQDVQDSQRRLLPPGWHVGGVGFCGQPKGECSSFLPMLVQVPGASVRRRLPRVTRVVLVSAAASGHTQQLEPHYQEQAMQEAHTPFWTLEHCIFSLRTLRTPPSMENNGMPIPSPNASPDEGDISD